MKKNIKDSKKRKFKGFTLVEVIVVMVILAILAALLLPSLTGYIDKANEQSAIVEARSILTALQTTSSEMYGRNTEFRGKKAEDKSAALNDSDVIKDVLDLAELTDKGTLSGVKCTAQAKVTEFKWDNGTYTVEFKNSDFNVTANSN